MCWRIRMNFGNGGEDYAQRAWELDRVGIWYGSWQPQDLYDAYGDERPPVAANVAASLNRTMAARGTNCEISKGGVHSARRFDDLLADAWIFSYFNRTLHFAQISDETLVLRPGSVPGWRRCVQVQDNPQKEEFRAGRTSGTIYAVGSRWKKQRVSRHELPGSR